MRGRGQRAGVHPATGLNTDKNATNFYVSTDYLPGTTTGVSAADRTSTVKAFCDPTNPPASFSKPGHMVPLCARKGGVLERPGHTESTYDLCKLSGCQQRVGVLAEMMHEDGTMYRKTDSLAFAKEHGFPMVTVEQLIAYRKANEAPEPVAPRTSKPGGITLEAESSLEVQAVQGKCALKVFSVAPGGDSP